MSFGNIEQNLPKIKMNSLDTASRASSDEIFSSKSVVSFVIENGEKSCDMMELNEEKVKQCEIEHDKQRARYSATVFLSVLYALNLALVGIVFPVTEALLDRWRTSGAVAAFLLYMSGGSVIFLTYLLINVELGNRRDKTGKNEQCNEDSPSNNPNNKQPKDIQNHFQANVTSFQNHGFTTDKLQTGEFILLSPISENVTKERSPSTSSENSAKLKDANEAASEDVSDNLAAAGNVEDLSSISGNETEEVMKFISINTQTASQAHEGTSFYLRFGFLLFAIAYILFLALEIDYFYADDGCEHNNKYAWVLFFHLAFVLVQTYFLFKHQKLNYIKKRKRLLRFGLMHVVATNFVVWIRAMVSEIREGIHTANPDDHSSGFAVSGANGSANDTNFCPEDVVLTASHYLFPFILEYSLIAVAIFLGMFTSLDIRINGEVLQSIKRYIRHAKQQPKVEEQSHQPTKMLEKAHSGLYIGMLCLTGTIIAFILIQYKLSNDQDNPELEIEAEIIYFSTDITLTTFATLGVVIGIMKMHHLRISFLRSHGVDFLLLGLSLVGLLLYNLFKAVCMFYTITDKGATTSLILDATCNLLIMMEALLQTIFIVAGMKSYSERKEDRINKPGRGAITFLILINLSIWFLKSFAEKDIADHIMEGFYGIIPWQIILHATLPLLLFFRFHSSVCLADMWLSAYENENSPIEYVDLS